MEFQINKTTDFPIYQQLKEHIKYFMLSGVLQPGTRLPPPKDLAGYLRINKNTVIVAYKELEKEGMIVTRHGQGTYVAEDLPPAPGIDRRKELIALAREALERARELGFTAEDLFTVVFGQTVLGLGSSRTSRALFVECNQPDINYFVEQLCSEIGITVEGCLLPELAERLEDGDAPAADFVVTTFFHIEDVKAICEPLDKRVFAVMAAPELSVLMQVGQLPADTRVGFVCATGESTHSMCKSLEAAGINHIEYRCVSFEDQRGFEELLAEVSVVVGCRSIINQVRANVPPGITVLGFDHVLEKGGVNLLKEYLEAR